VITSSSSCSQQHAWSSSAVPCYFVLWAARSAANNIADDAANASAMDASVLAAASYLIYAVYMRWQLRLLLFNTCNHTNPVLAGRFS
jgi:hypothetical protein